MSILSDQREPQDLSLSAQEIFYLFLLRRYSGTRGQLRT